MESTSQDGLSRADEAIGSAVGNRPRMANGRILRKGERARYLVARMPEPHEKDSIRAYDALVLKIMKAAEPKALSLDEIWSWLISMGCATHNPHRQSLDRKVQWKRLRRLLNAGFIRMTVNANEDLLDAFDPVI